MKAIVREKYGSPDVLQLKEVAKPTPKEDEVLIKIHATGMNAADWRILRAQPFLIRLMMGFFTPKIKTLGADVAGQVAAIGSNVTTFKVGDEVYAELPSFGGFAEYVCAPANLIAPKPKTLSFAETAAIPMAALTALQGLRDVGEIKAGQQVMIHGASGGVGSFAVQIAKALGAEVTAVCSTSKAQLARSLGADHIIDYKKEDFTQNGKLYDLIFVANGDRSVSDYMGTLTANGRYVLAGGSMKQLFQTLILGPIKSRAGGKTVKDFTARASQADLHFLNEMIEAGKITPIIETCYPLEETADAMRYLEKGHAKGKIIITMTDDTPH